MDIAEVVRELEVFALWPRAFGLDELLALVGPTLRHQRLRSVLDSDSRFICLRSTQPGEDRFVLDTTLFRWFTNLNFRLAHVQQYRLNESHVAGAMSHLRASGRWRVPPSEAIDWGRSLGLIGRSSTSCEYVFPLARMLSFLSRSSSRLAKEVFEDFAEERTWESSLGRMVEEHLQKAFSHFDERSGNIVKGRMGLLTGVELTLEEAGSAYGLTRERSRQLEDRFWRKLNAVGGVGRRRKKAFLAALLCDFMHAAGSLVTEDSSSKRHLRVFLCRCAGIDHVPLSQMGVVVLGLSPGALSPLDSRDWFPDQVDADAIACCLESQGRVALIDTDIRILAERVAQLRRDRLTGTQRVYLALRAIGGPAHYSRITDAHNSLFPDRITAERSVLAFLNREEHGVVWVGVRGTYALEEWGYERPSATLFERVNQIVQSVYEVAGKPVPFAVLQAEIGKYRRIVNPASLRIAAYCNPELRRVGKDSFVPRGPDDQDQEEVSSEELDRILREFEQAT